MFQGRIRTALYTTRCFLVRQDRWISFSSGVNDTDKWTLPRPREVTKRSVLAAIRYRRGGVSRMSGAKRGSLEDGK